MTVHIGPFLEIANELAQCSSYLQLSVCEQFDHNRIIIGLCTR
uniref:Uncharacterized protein n=1 Tax=Anguilla anguilla TaxID=7936 RepID=A0A0E9RT25_ANGAN